MTTNVFVNGQRKTVEEVKKLGFADVVMLAQGNKRASSWTVVTYQILGGGHVTTLLPGQSVTIREGMMFTVMETNV